jgi:N-acetylgalactosamine-N,N'-diacetylbacillosaminyl-diphospho-undecaprenol 4-alpha-N-acetylgalactosaminyltransferase
MAVRRLYPHADRVIAVSKGVGQELVRSYGLQAKQIATIYNPVEIATIENAARELPSIALPPEYVVAMGRLVPNKNFSMLLRSYADAKIAIPLVILGEGPERSRLASLAGELGIADRVVMPGFVSNPHAIVARSSFYVSSSDAEGFPNAMLEAMCVGRPVIATDCDSGPAEILQDGSHTHKVSELTRAKYGILVPARNVHAMSDALRSMGDPETHAHFSAAARHRAREFNLEAALERYKAVIASVVPGPARHLSSTIRYH